MSEHKQFEDLMAQGAALHSAGKVEQALVQFEKALAAKPSDTQAASACATMLSMLGQPESAFRVLDTVRESLLTYPDGATNYAIAAESCGRMDVALSAYARALELDPIALRALNNTALIQARNGDWDGAIDKLSRCRMLAAHEPSAWLNLTDTLIAARRFAQARDILTEATLRFPQVQQIAVRQAIALAFDGQIEAADAAMDRLDADARTMLNDLVAGADMTRERLIRRPLPKSPDAYELFCQQAFDALQVCDWRDHDRLTAVIREMLARAMRTGQGRDWRDAQLCGLMLPLQEDEMAALRVLSIATIGQQLTAPMKPFAARRSGGDGRIRVGLAIQSLREVRFANALQRQLALHDRSRFAIHVYSPTPEPDLAVTQRVGQDCASVVEIAHMTDDEAVARMRLDDLDIFVDMAFDTPWCRPEIPERRVAPIQIRQTTWHRHHPPRPCEYNMSDTFVHPDGLDTEKYGAVVRLPHTCWLATNDDLPDEPAPTRAELGLPPQALVLCAFLPALMVDRQSFALWMKLLAALPDAVVWLPPYARQTRLNLIAAATAAGIDSGRLVFQQRGSRARMLAAMPLADLFVDTLRFNANHGLVDALRMGVPAVSCAGQNMASRLGGSILRAAGLADCVVESAAALTAKVLQLAQDPQTLLALRARLASQRDTAPLFDPAARVREWESAWSTMVDRHRAGLPPAAFDVVPAPATVLGRPA